MLISFVRHGRTIANAGGLLQGRIDHPLDQVGIAQARATVVRVGPADRVVSSPLRRALETAAIIAGDNEVHVDPRWVELDYGAWEGRPVGDVPAETWQQWRDDLDFAPPEGESLRALGDRVRAALDQLAEDPPVGHLVIVTHVSPIKAAVAWALGVGDEIGWRTRLDNASITRLRIDGGRVALLTFNEVPPIGEL